MVERCLLVVVFMSAGALAASQSAAQTGSALTPEEAEALLKEHNDARDKVNVVQHVTWSKDLAKYAQDWADHIAETGKFEHRPDLKYGENLAAGVGQGYGVKQAVAIWLKEKEAYDAGKREKVLHYTQMVWSRTTHIGAGKAVIKEGPMKGWTVVVCNYDPPGNVRGEKPYP